MDPFVIDVPSIPPGLNKVLRMHWATKSNMSKAWLSFMFLFPFEQRMKLHHWANAKCRMKITVTFHHSRMFDKDNLYGTAKVIFDAFKHAGYIHDDRPEFLLQDVHQKKCAHKARHTTIAIEPATGS